jgi:uncharacterized membrane protein YgcG
MRRTVVLLAGATVAVVASCRAPTQARLLVTTPARCSETNGVAITAKAAPLVVEQAVDSGFVSATATACEQRGALGDYGDLVLAPGADTGAVVVVAGYGATRAETCKPANKYKGCIVARRAFSYLEHATITIPVSLEPDCVDVPCDALSTCRKGRCVDSRVDCTESGCTGASLPPPPGSADAGPESADSGSDAGGASDGGASDAAAEAGSDGGGGDGGSGATRCGSGLGPNCRGFLGGPNLPCAVDQTCCVDMGGSCEASPGGAVGCGGRVAVCCSSTSECTGGKVCCTRPPVGGATRIHDCVDPAECNTASPNVLCDDGVCPVINGKTPITCTPGSFPYKVCQYP